MTDKQTNTHIRTFRFIERIGTEGLFFENCFKMYEHGVCSEGEGWLGIYTQQMMPDPNLFLFSDGFPCNCYLPLIMSTDDICYIG